MARRRRINPPRQPICNIRRIAQRRPGRALQITTLRKRARVVDSRRLVVSRDIRHADAIEDARQPVSRRRPRRPILDHAVDLGRRTGRLHDAVFVAHVDAGVVLHQARVDNAPVGRVDAHAALRILHHDCQDEAVVDLCRFRDRLDRVVDLVDLLRAVVRDAEGGAGAGHGDFVGGEPCIAMGRQCQTSGPEGAERNSATRGSEVPRVWRRASLHVLERDPEVLAGPAIRHGAVTAVEDVLIVAAAAAVMDVTAAMS